MTFLTALILGLITAIIATGLDLVNGSDDRHPIFVFISTTVIAALTLPFISDFFMFRYDWAPNDGYVWTFFVLACIGIITTGLSAMYSTMKGSYRSEMLGFAPAMLLIIPFFIWALYLVF